MLTDCFGSVSFIVSRLAERVFVFAVQGDRYTSIRFRMRIMALLSTHINGFMIDTLNPMVPMLRSTVQKAQQLDDQYFGPVNAKS